MFPKKKKANSSTPSLLSHEKAGLSLNRRALDAPQGGRAVNPHQTDVSESLIRRGGGKYAPRRKWPILAIFLHSMRQKWGQVTKGRQMLTLIGSRTRLGPSLDHDMSYNTPNMALYILTIFLHSMPQIWDQVTQWRQMLTPIGSRTRLGPSMDPAMALQYTKHGPSMDPAMALQYTKHGPCLVYCRAMAGSI